MNYSEFLASQDVGEKYDFPVGEIIECYKMGMGQRRIGAKFGISDKQLLEILSENGVDRHPVGGGVTIVAPDNVVTSMVADYEAGASICAIGKKYGFSNNVVERYLVNNGVTKRPPDYTEISDELASQMATDYESGLTLRDISCKHGLYYEKVRDAIAATGVTIRVPGQRQNRIPTDIAVACYEAGESLKEIVKKHGSSTNTLRRQLIEAGVTMRPFRSRRVPA